MKAVHAAPPEPSAAVAVVELLPMRISSSLTTWYFWSAKITRSKINQHDLACRGIGLTLLQQRIPALFRRAPCFTRVVGCARHLHQRNRLPEIPPFSPQSKRVSMLLIRRSASVVSEEIPHILKATGMDQSDNDPSTVPQAAGVVAPDRGWNLTDTAITRPETATASYN